MLLKKLDRTDMRRPGPDTVDEAVYRTDMRRPGTAEEARSWTGMRRPVPAGVEEAAQP